MSASTITARGGGPLSGLHVVDLTCGMPGAVASMLLADYGADVVKIERPGGDQIRSVPAWSVWGRGKRSVELDLADGAGRASLDPLLARADVLLHSYAPETATRLGLSPKSALPHPRLIVCSLTGYGTGDPRSDQPAYDNLVAARLGLMYDQPGHRAGPIFLGFPMVNYGAALLGVLGVSAALLARQVTGKGQHVDVSLYDALLALHTMTWWWSERDVYMVNAATVGKRFGNHRLLLRMFECGDGEYIQVHTGARGAFTRAMEVFGLTDRVKPPKGLVELAEPLTAAEADLVWDELPKLFRSRPRVEWLQLLWASEVAAQPVLRPGEIFADPQALFNDMVLELNDPVFGPVQQVGPAVRFSATPAHVRGPAPRSGEHTREVLDAPEPPPLAQLPARRAATAHPLAGIRVLEIGTYVTAPLAARLLCDLGAEVIKVEGLEGEPMRPLAESFEGASRGKRSLAVDLKHEAGIALLHRLAADADVVVHNMRPGVAERLKIDAATLRRLNPHLIYCACPGFGSAGPKAHLQSFAPLLSGLAGLEYLAAGRDNPPIGALGNEDYFSGMLTAAAIVMALVARGELGDGQEIELPQLNAVMFVSSDVLVRGPGEVITTFELDQAQTGYGPLYRLYPTADGWICIACVTEQHYDNLFEALDLGRLRSDPRWATMAASQSHAGELATVLTEQFAKLATEECCERFRRAGVPSEVPRGPEARQELFHDPLEQALGRVVEQTHPQWGRVREIAQLIRFSDTPGCDRGPAPLLGQHTRQILLDAGYSGDEIQRLHTDGVIGMNN